MKLGKVINEETYKEESGYLTFDSGLKLLLTLDEVKEFEVYLKMIRAEGKASADKANVDAQFEEYLDKHTGSLI